MVATYEGRVLKIPEAQRTNELQSFSQDLLRVHRFCEAFLDMCNQHPHGFAVGEAADGLLIAIVVTYARMFNGGVRRYAGIVELAKEVYNAREMELHEYLLLLRDKHIAHSVNAFEDFQTTVMVNIEAQPLVALSIGGFGRHTYGINAAEVEQLNKMCLQLRESVRRKIESENSALMETVKKIPSEELAKLDAPMAEFPDLRRVWEKRKSQH